MDAGIGDIALAQWPDYLKVTGRSRRTAAAVA